MMCAFWAWFVGCSCNPSAHESPATGDTGVRSSWPSSPDELEGTFIDVALSDSLRCALRDNGQVSCWGGAPPPLIDNYTFVEIDGASSQICGVTPKHDIVCYAGLGSAAQASVDTIGRLGTLERFSAGGWPGEWCALVDGTAICDFVDFEEPGLLGVVRGDFRACAWAEGGRAICHCRGSCYQADIKDVFPGTFHLRDGSLHPRVCAVGLSGTVICVSGYGQPLLGPGTFGDFERVWTSDGHACARTTGGEVICWGADRIPGPEGDGFGEVSMALDHACGIQNGKVVCWTL